MKTFLSKVGLGIFLCVSAFAFAQIPTKSSTSCCKTKESKDCCKTNSPKEKQSHTNDCQDCCGTLHSCSVIIEITYIVYRYC